MVWTPRAFSVRSQRRLAGALVLVGGLVSGACGGGGAQPATTPAVAPPSPTAAAQVPTPLARPALASPIASPSPVALVPTRAPTAVATPSGPEQTYSVAAGDTLLGIAEKVYADATKWRRIYDANRDVIGADPDALKIDMKLKIPPKE